MVVGKTTKVMVDKVIIKFTNKDHNILIIKVVVKAVDIKNMKNMGTETEDRIKEFNKK